MDMQEKTYKPLENERDVYHLLLEHKSKNGRGDRKFVQKFGKKKIKERIHHLKQQGYGVTVLFDPEKKRTRNAD